MDAIAIAEQLDAGALTPEVLGSQYPLFLEAYSCLTGGTYKPTIKRERRYMPTNLLILCDPKDQGIHRLNTKITSPFLLVKEGLWSGETTDLEALLNEIDNTEWDDQGTVQVLSKQPGENLWYAQVTGGRCNAKA